MTRFSQLYPAHLVTRSGGKSPEELLFSPKLGVTHCCVTPYSPQDTTSDVIEFVRLNFASSVHKVPAATEKAAPFQDAGPDKNTKSSGEDHRRLSNVPPCNWSEVSSTSPPG